jgi:nucleoside-diphosphate-sugar epimerase
MKILVTGGNGFVGRELTKRLLAGHFPDPQSGEPLGTVTELVVVDISGEGLPEDARLRVIEGSIADSRVLQQATENQPDVVFHLASIPGGAAEKNYKLGLDVNLQATLALLEILREQGHCPRFVFTSTIAVYGSDLPALVDDSTPLKPKLSYGTHKLVGEILIEDYSQKGWIKGCSVRLPGIVARPPSPSGLLSAFMSNIFWKLSAKEEFVCPVSSQAVAWWMSVPCCVENLIHGAQMPSTSLDERRVYTLPAMRLTMAQLVDGLADLFGEDCRDCIRYEPDEGLEKAFGAYPPIDNSAALAVGFKQDESVAALIEAAMSART